MFQAELKYTDNVKGQFVKLILVITVIIVLTCVHKSEPRPRKLDASPLYRLYRYMVESFSVLGTWTAKLNVNLNDLKWLTSGMLQHPVL
jgi:hypothetical protein